MPETAFERALRSVLTEIRVETTPQAFDKMVSHYQLLEKWNRGLNLTRISTPLEAARRHFGESLLLAHAVGSCESVADIGSGGGFPGLPIAAANPALAVTLIESVAKKAAFLRETSREWGNVRVLAQRAEDVSGTFDCVVMRAVRAEPLLGVVAQMSPRLGLLAGEDTVSELQASTTWTWEPPVSLPWGDRRFILIGERST